MKDLIEDVKNSIKLIPNKKAFCVFDLLNILYKNSAYYIPTNNYKKISATKSEKSSNFKTVKDSAIGSFRTLSFNKTKLNISIDYSYEGIVEIDKNDNISLPNKITAKSFKKHTLVKDGIFNMDNLKCAVTIKTLKELNKKYYDIVDEKEINNEKYIVIEIDLKKIPIINMSMNESSLDEIINEVSTMNYLKNKLKNIKNNIKETQSDTYYLFKYLTEEEIEILKTKYNISRQGWYSAPYKKPDKNELDFYTAKEIEFVYDKEQIISISDNIKEIQDVITEIELSIMGKKLAKVLTGTFWNELKEIKTDKYQYNDFIVKTKKTKVYYKKIKE